MQMPRSALPRSPWDRWARRVLLVEGLYLLLTGVWPLLHLGSFEAVTGPKTDDWLVQLIGLLSCTIGAGLLGERSSELPVRSIALLLGLGTAFCFLAIDVSFALSGAISRVYLADGVVQAVFCAALITILFASTRATATPGWPSPGAPLT